jgi:hypothetical protein
MKIQRPRGTADILPDQAVLNPFSVRRNNTDEPVAAGHEKFLLAVPV